MLQIQLIYTWLEDKFYPDASRPKEGLLRSGAGTADLAHPLPSRLTQHIFTTRIILTYSEENLIRRHYTRSAINQPKKPKTNLINQLTTTNSHQITSIINSNIICAFCHRIRFLTEKQIDNSRREKYGIHAFYMVYPVYCCLIFYFFAAFPVPHF
jgi:hypothetical protein